MAAARNGAAATTATTADMPAVADAVGGTEDPGRIGMADAVLAMTKVAARSSVTVKATRSDATIERM